MIPTKKMDSFAVLTIRNAADTPEKEEVAVLLTRSSTSWHYRQGAIVHAHNAIAAAHA